MAMREAEFAAPNGAAAVSGFARLRACLGQESIQRGSADRSVVPIRQDRQPQPRIISDVFCSKLDLGEVGGPQPGAAEARNLRPAGPLRA